MPVSIKLGKRSENDGKCSNFLNKVYESSASTFVMNDQLEGLKCK